MNAKAPILAVLLLAGCAPTEAEISAVQHAQCIEYGYQPGTDGYAACRLAVRQIALAEKAQEQAAWNALSASIGQAQQNLLLEQYLSRPAAPYGYGNLLIVPSP